MKNSLILLILLFTGCASFQVSTLNHDPIYSIEGSDAEITVINNEFELQRLLRDDFNFRYDFAQYAKSQPISFDWNNRILRNSRFNRYNYNNRYSWSNGWGYSSYWNRDQMWDDWLWGYQYGNGIGWSYSWNNNRWSSNSWNNYYGWGNGYGWNNYNRYRGTNVAYHRGRRSGVVNTNGRAHAAMIQSTKVKKRRTVNIVTPPRKVIRTKPVRRTRTVIPSVRVNTPTRTTKPTRITSNRTQPTRKVNSRRKN
jgi:hypothetical protein|tara:strand:- start:665 stop:1423 length:759 start_codon:yes stop_codon:yes gene_type:complete